jgi:uncharacterized protein (TIGR00369 family)
MTESLLTRNFEADGSQKLAEGFIVLPDGLGFNDAFAPVYVKVDEQGWRCGFYVEKHHLNPQGVCHGGVLMSFADLAMAGNVGHSIGEMMGIFTINMTVDFLSPGRLGHWLEMHLLHLHSTRTMVSISGIIKSDDGVVARTNAIYRLPKKPQDKNADSQ